jgi:hypothetical protein
MTVLNKSAIVEFLTKISLGTNTLKIRDFVDRETLSSIYPRADGEGTNSPRLFTPGETKALAKCKVHQ